MLTIRDKNTDNQRESTRNKNISLGSVKTNNNKHFN